MSDPQSDPQSRLPAHPSLERLRKQAKARLKQLRLITPEAKLADVQFEIARQYGFETWANLKGHIDKLGPPGLELYEQLVKDLAAAIGAADPNAIREINWNYGTSFPWKDVPAQTDARTLVANFYGFGSWNAFSASVNTPAGDPRSAAVFMSSAPPFYRIDWKENRLESSGPHSAKEWDILFALIKEHGIAKLSAGAMDDSAMKRLAKLGHLTHLNCAGSKALTDTGLGHLAKMPQLIEIDIGGWTSPITDRGLEALRELENLRSFTSCWTQHISDKGLAHLAASKDLEIVNLIGTHSGDGTLRALTGKQKLRRLRIGRGVTDAGLKLLHEFPVFKTWRGGKIQYDLMTFDPEPNFLMLDGAFTDAGLASLAGLDGLFGLTFFWHCPDFTSAGLASLKRLPNLGFLGCQDAHCDDEAMRHIAALPKLRMLMGQGAVATDAGFAALGQSQSIENLWGRECPNFGTRGFSALANMPSLRGLAIGLKNVDSVALSTLPRFPALRDLMPMDVTDESFRHIGECDNLERLWCMYCRETGDLATEHIARLPKLKTYYAGKTQITDRSLQLLGRIRSLERLEFWQCAGLTNSGIAHIASLPNLREVVLDGLPGVTREAVALFPETVRVVYSG